MKKNFTVSLELVNWGKNIHEFYNKFSAANYMHYIKCGVNILLFT
jgi:hypothetical protein